ncbi:IclR family transcriptional regulator [Sinanaerobacter sp. ZZT-01]|uniref:IclR family transcriptional regulator n=1 Tax=Sinanaerobacter sp. ZZT-01 TaxID=3111540 RepID=UPI002D786194|nr:IclR family transcriptional regulator [Sinanaerobacter sp. ZZT-01]WRR94592.1 IclR family transcriptional regulator [Sinanaerobacter sp. ZZT-01]
MDTQQKNHINSILRAIELLNLFGKDAKEMGISEISRKMNLHKSSVYRIVKTLEFAGWLEQNSVTDKYKLGMKIMDVGSTILKTYDYKDVISKGMRELMAEVHETIVLSTYTDLCGICIDLIEAENYITYTSKLGHKTPVYSGATGKILLAYQSEEEIQRVIEHGLTRFTPNTISNEEELRSNLKEIREKGYATSFEETDPGVSAIGGPIFNGKKELIYGISIVGPTERLKQKNIEHLIELVIEKSKEITQKIENISY